MSDGGAGHPFSFLFLYRKLGIDTWRTVGFSTAFQEAFLSPTTHDLTFVVESQGRAEVTLGSCAPAPMTDADIDAMQM